MCGRVNVWRITKLKIIGEKKFGEWIDFGYKDITYKLKFENLQSTDDSPNFTAAKLSHFMVYSYHFITNSTSYLNAAGF